MIGVRTPVGPEEVRFDAGHVLFVEGRGDDAIDPTVLRVLLGNQLRIEPLGASFSVTSVAEALHQILSSNLFRVEDRDGNIVSGTQERNEITRDLLQRDEAVQPPDFSELKRIIKRRIDAR